MWCDLSLWAMKAYNLPLLVKLSDPAASFQWNIKHKPSPMNHICNNDLWLFRDARQGWHWQSHQIHVKEPVSHTLSPSLKGSVTESSWVLAPQRFCPWVQPKGRHSLQLGSSWNRDLQQEQPCQAQPFKSGAHFFYLLSLDLAPDSSV